MAFLSETDGTRTRNHRIDSPGSFGALGDDRFDLILAAFPFDNIPMPMKETLIGA